MANLTLGLDLGCNSIGWAIIDHDEHRIIRCGVRVFPEGVETDKGREISRNEQRRVARRARRRTTRRARRRRRFREALVEANLLPKVASLAVGDSQRVAWERVAGSQADPYTLRKRGLRTALTPHEFGCVLLHLNQRRGFLSNRRIDCASKDTASAMMTEISTLAAQIGTQTLGAYLADRRDGDPKRAHLTRLRGWHTHRQMYLDEFARLWAAQQPHHPDLLTDALRQTLHDIMFFQRPVRVPVASLIGRCELEPRLPRCPRADRRAQRFRMLLEINNLRVIDARTGVERPLSSRQRWELLAYLAVAKERTFDQVRKRLFAADKDMLFNLERGGRTALKGMPSDAALAHRKLLGPKWHQVDETLKDRIIAALLDAEAERLAHLFERAGLDGTRIADILDGFDPESGYASYSLYAIKKLLPHVAHGLPLTCGDVRTPCALREAGYQMPWERTADRTTLLPKPPEIGNPLVRQALREVRKVVNAILREYVHRQCHHLAIIRIELLREIKGTAQRRAQRAKQIRTRQKLREEAAHSIRKAGYGLTRSTLERYLLWKEQSGLCAYAHPSRTISLTRLFEGDVQVDHILPYSRSLDNSLMNKVVCLSAENQEKGNRTPREWLAASNPEKYDAVLRRSRNLPYAKLRRFLDENVQIEDFFARQFVDSAHIATQVCKYVECLGADVLCVKGQHTATLRRQWELDRVLHENPGNLKNRDDHRHHAVDAIVVALTDRTWLQTLAGFRQDDSGGQDFPRPWPGFRHDVTQAVGNIRVSYRVRRKVSGALHEETLYGPTAKKEEFVCRKSLDSLTPAMVDRIRDPVVRTLIVERIRQHPIEPTRRGMRIPAEVWAKPLYMKTKRTGAIPVPIRKVRVVLPSASIRPIRDEQTYVQPGNTHHLCLFEIPSSSGKTRREAVSTSMLEAYERLRKKEPAIRRNHPQHPHARFLMSLSSNEMLLLEHHGKEELYRFETASSTSGQMWFRLHTFAGKASDTRCRISKMPNTLRARKVTIDPLGRVRWAND